MLTRADIQHYIWLLKKLESLKPRTKFFNILRPYLRTKGYWKNKKRGLPGFNKGTGVT